MVHDDLQDRFRQAECMLAMGISNATLAARRRRHGLCSEAFVLNLRQRFNGSSKRLSGTPIKSADSTKLHGRLFSERLNESCDNWPDALRSATGDR
jgi:hypothetical protein